MSTKKPILPDASAEEKIKEAARRLFTQKGYEGTKTRDIANEAGINLALLNYYFRSKENLFEIVMLENVRTFFMGIAGIFGSDVTTFEEKISLVVDAYISMLIEHPELPLFILTEARARPDRLAENLDARNIIFRSPFMKQLVERAGRKKVDPLQFFLNLFALTVGPFIMAPIVRGITKVSEKDFRVLMEDRKKLIPQWIALMLK